jgi:ATP-dependent Lon protease
MEGTGKLELTGSLGDVMKESAHAAITYARQVASEYGISPDFYAKKDIHIHFPEGAVPKDGPSAGITTLTALISALSGIPVRRDLSMTGEITIRGNVLPIGGLREKTMAAYSAGVRTVIIPADNLKDLHEVDPVVRENVTFIPCSRAHEVLSNALVRENAAAMEKAAPATVEDVVITSNTSKAPAERRAKSEK